MARTLSKVTFQSMLSETMRDIEKAERRVRNKASKHLVVKMKQKVSDQYFKGSHSRAGEPPGRMSGNLRKGIGYKDGKSETKVGVGPPAHHAHLLEFGTVPRNTPTKNGKSRYSGRVLPRPFVFSTFDEESETVKAILSERWL